MTSWSLDLAGVLRQVAGRPVARGIRELLAVALAPGESGAVFLLAGETDASLAAAVPDEAPFASPAVRALAARAVREAPSAPEDPAMLVVPVPVAGAPGGALVVLASGPAVAGATRRRAPLVAALAGVLAEAGRAADRAGQAEGRLAHVRQLARLAKPGRDLAEVGQAVLDLAVELVGGEAGGLWLRRRRGGDLALVAARRARGRRAPRPSLARAEVEPLAGAAPLACPPHPLVLPRTLLRDDALGAALLFPLHHEGELVGLLVAARGPAASAFAAAGADRVVELVELATLPVLDVCRREELGERGRQVRATRRIARAVAAGVELDEAFRVATAELTRLCPFDVAALVLPVEPADADPPVWLAEPGRHPRPVRPDGALAGGVAEPALRAGRAVVVADRGAGPMPPSGRDLEGARAVLAVPLAPGRGGSGALLLGSRTRGRFRGAHLRLVRPIADLLAVAVRQDGLRRAAAVGVEERGRLLERLVRTERDAVIGRLASALAHEIRNPLTVIGATVQYLRDRLPEGHDHRTLLDAADRKVREMDSSLENVLSFSRPLDLKPGPVDLAGLLDDVAAFVRPRAARHAVEVAVEAEPGLRPAGLDRRRAEQALLNLALTALDAMPAGGRLRFGARAGEGDELVVTVADTGPGIDTARLGVLFEPDAPTRRRGPGLGLAITRRIVEEHGGTIAAASEAGRGTTFTLRLPADRAGGG
jgi:signal transduction histidine kinase